jgi:hypothetical protein
VPGFECPVLGYREPHDYSGALLSDCETTISHHY